MADKFGKNDGVRVLTEFVCQAISAPSAQGSATAPGSVGRGTNQGLRQLEEVALAAGSCETPEAAQQRQENLPRALIRAIFYARALELEKRLPVSLDDLDLSPQGREATARIVFRYLTAREMELMRPSEIRSTFLIDLAMLMTDLARPQGIFCAQAPKTAMYVAGRLLRYEGWDADPAAVSEWQVVTEAIDPAGPRAAKEYLSLLRRYWGWVGPSTETAIDAEEFASAVAIPEAVLAGLTRHCT